MSYNHDDEQQSNVVGSFVYNRNTDFVQGLSSTLESFTQRHQMNPIHDLQRILYSDTAREQYKEDLIGDIVGEAASFEDPYLALMPEKLEQLFENTYMQMVTEASSVGQISPIVAMSLPVLKKNYLETHAKDIIMTEVPSKPIVKVSFERRFLKDKAGNKYYIPEIFYDDSYKQVIGEMVGNPVSQLWYPETGSLPVQDLNLLEESGGSLATRDRLALDFVIDAVQIDVGGTTVTPDPEIKEIAGLHIVPDTGVNGGAGIGSFTYRVKATNSNNEVIEEILSGQVTFYDGKVSVTSTGTRIKKVRFGGHLSNENNNRTVELDKERENKTWQIPDGKRINTGITIEEVADFKALMNMDITSERIADMSTVLSQIEDSTMLGFLEDEFNVWKNRKDLPFGYTGGFVEQTKFSAMPPVGMTNITPSQWVNSELKWYLNRQIDQLKVKLRAQDIMFVIYGHPNLITLIQDDVKWVIDEDTKIGGIQLDYRFGVMTANKNRVHVVSTLKSAPSKGIRIVAYPLSKEVITFKHYKYSLNIENVYRNPNTPNIPNVMATSRYLTTSLLPVQGEFTIENNDYGRVALP